MDVGVTRFLRALPVCDECIPAFMIAGQLGMDSASIVQFLARQVLR